MRPKRLLWFLVIIFIGLSAYYSFTTPLFESPDEIWHYQFIQEVAVKHGLPVVIPSTDQPFRHEGLQPPLYYILGAGVIAWMNPRDLVNLPAPNTFVRIGEPAFASNDNRNAFLHTSAEAFPYRGAALAVHLLRLYSVLLGAATIVFAYLLACEMVTLPSTPALLKTYSAHSLPIPPPQFAGRGQGGGPNPPAADPMSSILLKGEQGEVNGERIGLLAAAFVAFLPQFLFISGAVNNDNLATLLSTAALWLLARLVRHGLAVKSALALGLLVGGAMLAKASTVALAPVALLVIAYLTWRNRAWLEGVKVSAVFLSVLALIAGWWFARNVQIYGEVYPLTPLVALVGARTTPLSLWRWITAEGEGLRLSTWGVFGWFNILSAPWFYLLYDVLAALGLVGVTYALIRRVNLSPRLTILPLWIIASAFALWRYSSVVPSTQGRLLFPALPAWGVLWAWGTLTLVPNRFHAWAMGALGVLLFASALLTPTLFIAPAYTPTLLTESEVPPDVTKLDRHFENGIEWLGASLDRKEVRAGDSFEVTLYERVPAGAAPSSAIFIHLVNSAEVIVAQRDSFVGSGNLGTRQGPSVVADSLRVAIPVTVPAPDEWRIEIGMYNPESDKRYTTFDQGGRDLGETTVLSTLKGQAGLPAEWNFDFDGRVSLTGANLDRTAVARGDVLRLTLQWRGGSTGPARYRVFAHALGENNHIWAAADASIDGQSATQLELPFDGATPAGVYPLEVGVYPAPDGDRLEVFNAHGQDLGDRVFLGPVRVTP